MRLVVWVVRARLILQLLRTLMLRCFLQQLDPLFSLLGPFSAVWVLASRGFWADGPTLYMLEASSNSTVSLMLRSINWYYID
jgi:hypothetical protein